MPSSPPASTPAGHARGARLSRSLLTRPFRRLAARFRDQLAREDLARVNAAFIVLDERLGHRHPLYPDDPLERLWKLSQRGPRAR